MGRKRRDIAESCCYHPTLIEPGHHLSRCLYYIDLNMVRAGVVKHPAGWKYSGYHELAGMRKKYRIINTDCLLECLGLLDKNRFYKWYNSTIDKEVEKNYHSRQPAWTEALAVGGKEWVENLSNGLSRTKILPVITESTQAFTINEAKEIYGLHGGYNAQKQFWKIHQKIS